MLINDEAQRQLLQLFARSSNIPKIEAEQQSASQLQLTPGQQVQAEVMAKLPNHLFLARIAGELFKMELPLNVQPGETMHLTFVSAEPRFIFELARPENGRLPVTISTTGKWLSSLVNGSAGEAGRANQSGSSAQILDGLPTDTGYFATRLKEALSTSGLFYESHLAEWARGERPLDQLMMEPQGKLSPRLKVQNREGGLPENLETHGNVMKGIAEEKVNSKASAPPIADHQALPIIKDQLAALNSGMILWSGQAWPGQNVELAVQEREAGGSDRLEREWETTIKLQMPVLGGISATLHFSATGLHIALRTDEASTEAILRQGASLLQERVDGMGIDLIGIVVNDEKGGE
ncbi:flagellar hook-length control protein FliK [Geotalea sp. SG265]|uniref:flagellar hook-length control protein FliK n=1 Tax=Geotalea sp. SG265 TaxID=2922867 RepID=UPI001FAED847|nr:flagellar hook-length control protein FliK [Geotalea sp. SG265]